MTQGSVSDNFVDRTSVGIHLGGYASSDGTPVTDNIVHHASIFGINLRFGANHWRVGLNDLKDNALDVNLQAPMEDPSYDPGDVNFNTIRLLPGQTYFDGGSGNRIVIGN